MGAREPAAGGGWAAEALDALPDGLMIFDADWSVVYLNPAGARLLGRVPERLVGRNLWVALPMLAGSILHSFLLHARSVGGPVTWRGFYPPARRWLMVTAVRVGDRLHVSFRPADDHAAGYADSDSEADADAEGEAEAQTGPGTIAPLAGTTSPTWEDLRGTAARRREGGDVDRLRFLAEVSEVMVSTLDTGEAAGMLAQLVVPRLCDWAVVTVRGDDGAVTDPGRAHRDPDRLADLHTYLDRRPRGPAGEDPSPLAAALLSGEPVQLAPQDPRLVEPAVASEQLRAAWRRLDAGSAILVPLRTRGETFGALTLINTAGRRPHTEMELATAVEVARRGALALDNARLYGRQQAVAETLQRSLLTPPPHPDGVQLAARYLPAASNMHVGGDWYDAFAQPDGALQLVLGDVVGHNVDAAAAMGQLRSLVRGIAYDRQESPARILARVDEVLAGLHLGHLATALIARLEPPENQAAGGRRTLRWSSAGHLPPLILRADGRVQILPTRPEILLGVQPGRPRSDHTAALSPGDTLLLYTDGLVEHGRSDIDTGLGRLACALAENPERTVEELCDRLLASIVGGHAEDDIALVAVRCSDPAG